MSTMVVEQPFGIGRVIGQTFVIFFRHFLSMGGMAILLLAAPQIILFLFAVSAGSGDLGPVSIAPRMGLAYLAYFVFTFVLWGAVSFATFRALSGNPVSVLQALRKGLGKFFIVWAISIVAAVGTAAGVVLLVIPGIIVAIIWCLAVPASVVENTGVFTSLARSVDLTRGYRWSIFGLGLIYVVLSYAFVAVLMVILVAVALPVGEPAAAPSAYTTAIGGVIGALLANSFMTVLLMIGLSVLYAELRRAKEGIGADAIAQVFD
ncbi:MAG: hypothetical protein GC201_06070 [Alphaproteobacteria bacterium]|nr:hypothetical protein [Alphaproteobacteria bacterium]